MKKQYTYQKELEIPTGFNLWQHNFEHWPFSYMLYKAIKKTRKNVAAFQPLSGLSIKKSSYPSYDKEEIAFYQISPTGAEAQTLPVIIYYHGGGFIYPLDLMMLNNACYYARTLHCHVLLPDYRTAPDNSCQDILEDCYEMLSYADAHADQLHIDMKHLLIFGDSAGGSIAAGITLLSRDRKGPRALAQMLIYPVTDSRLDRYRSMNTLMYAEWTKKASKHMWHMLLKKGDRGLLTYFAPMQNPCAENLPPAYIEVQEYDTLRDQGIAYGKKLRESGIPVQIKGWKATCHGFDFDVHNPFVQRVLNYRCKVMQKFLQL